MVENRKYQAIGVAKLRLDPNNPRLPESLRGGKDEKKVLEWMLTDATLIDLMASIVENGFFEGEAIIAMQEGDGFVVLEGNRRLAALKLLKDPSLSSEYATSLSSLANKAKEKNIVPDELTVFVCNSRDEVENYLGFRHVSGVKEWPVISKARYVHHLYYKKISAGEQPGHEMFRELAREIGSKAPYVRRLLYGFYLFQQIEKNRFYRIEGLDEESFDFSFITDAALKFGEMSKYLGVDVEKDNPMENLSPERLKEVTHWLYQKIPGTGTTRVGESRNMKTLDKILKNEVSRQAFVKENASLQEAAMLSNVADDNFKEYLSRAKYFIQQAFNTVNKVRYPEEKDLGMIQDIRSTSEDIEFLMKKKIREKKRETSLQLEPQ